MLAVGSLQFQVDDYPETLVFGTTLKSVELNLSDGTRKLQKFGATADDITFQGTFMYEGALDRALTLKAMAESTVSVMFVCDAFSLPVSVKDCKTTLHNEFEVDYSVTLFVEKTRPSVVISPSTSLSQIHAAAQQAQSQVANTGNAAAILGLSGLIDSLQRYGN